MARPLLVLLACASVARAFTPSETKGGAQDGDASKPTTPVAEKEEPAMHEEWDFDSCFLGILVLLAPPDADTLPIGEMNRLYQAEKERPHYATATIPSARSFKKALWSAFARGDDVVKDQTDEFLYLMFFPKLKLQKFR